MAGLLVNTGKDAIADVMVSYLNDPGFQLWVALHTKTTAINKSDTVGTTITEILNTSVGYSRIITTNWVKVSNITTGDIYIKCDPVTFTVGAGGWKDVNGYCLMDAPGGGVTVTAELFSDDIKGDKATGDIITIIPVISLKNELE